MAVGVGFIALAGVAAEFGVIMLIYLNNACKERSAKGALNTVKDLKGSIMEGAVMRVRPKAMTVAVIIAGLIPIMIGEGTGSDVMQRIAAPMIGGMNMPPIEAAGSIPPATWGLKPAFFIIGMVKAPVDTVLAMAEPDIDPNSPLAITETLAGPPILWPTAARGKSIKNFWAPHFSRNAPKITKRIMYVARTLAIIPKTPSLL